MKSTIEEAIPMAYFMGLQKSKIPYEGYVKGNNDALWAATTHQSFIKLQATYSGPSSLFEMIPVIYSETISLREGNVNADTSLIGFQNKKQDITGKHLSLDDAQWYWSTEYPLDGLSYKEAVERNKKDHLNFNKYLKNKRDLAVSKSVNNAINTEGTRVVLATLSVPIAIITAAELALAASAANWAGAARTAGQGLQTIGRGASQAYSKLKASGYISTKMWGAKAAVSAASQALTTNKIDIIDVCLSAIMPVGYMGAPNWALQSIGDVSLNLNTPSTNKLEYSFYGIGDKTLFDTSVDFGTTAISGMIGSKMNYGYANDTFLDKIITEIALSFPVAGSAYFASETMKQFKENNYGDRHPN